MLVLDDLQMMKIKNEKFLEVFAEAINNIQFIIDFFKDQFPSLSKRKLKEFAFSFKQVYLRENQKIYEEGGKALEFYII